MRSSIRRDMSMNSFSRNGGNSAWCPARYAGRGIPPPRSIDAIGTLPTPDEVPRFLADTSPEKRAHLIDQLLDRNEYASYWANQWGDLLRNKRPLRRRLQARDVRVRGLDS